LDLGFGSGLLKKMKLTDTGFFGFSWILDDLVFSGYWMVWFFDLDIGYD
jgi:hypothetical protein